MNKITLTILILFFSIIGNAQTNRIKVKNENLTDENYLKVDDFYLTHYLYIDLFLRENLLPDAKLEEVSTVINAIKKYVSIENPLVIEVEKPNNNNYLIAIMLAKKENEELLICYTNWNPNLKTFEDGIKDDTYTRWYFLNSNKMTSRNDLSKEKDYSKLNNIDLSNAYLFDEIKDNDSKIEKLILEATNNEDINIEDYIRGQLILLKYYIFSQDKNKIQEVRKHIEKQFENNKDKTNLKGLEVAFKTTLFQIDLMK